MKSIDDRALRAAAVAAGLTRLRQAGIDGALARLCKRLGVELLTLHGSAARGDDQPQDLDLGVLFGSDELARHGMVPLVAALVELAPLRRAQLEQLASWLAATDEPTAGSRHRPGEARADRRAGPAPGENVYPKEVEDLLASRSDLVEVAVIGVDDPDFGQRLVAFIVPRDPADAPTPEQIKDHAKQHLARFSVPRDVIVLDELPRNPTGKVIARELRATLEGTSAG